MIGCGRQIHTVTTEFTPPVWLAKHKPACIGLFYRSTQQETLMPKRRYYLNAALASLAFLVPGGCDTHDVITRGSPDAATESPAPSATSPAPDTAAAILFDGFENYSRETETTSPPAQKYIDQGMVFPRSRSARPAMRASLVGNRLCQRHQHQRFDEDRTGIADRLGSAKRGTRSTGARVSGRKSTRRGGRGPIHLARPRRSGGT